jgi:hypothetical protein
MRVHYRQTTLKTRGSRDPTADEELEHILVDRAQEADENT